LADDSHLQEVPTGGADGAPRSLLKLVRGLAMLVLLVLGLWGASALLGRLPGDTSTGSLVIRGAIGLSIGLVLIVVVRRSLRALAAPPPAPPRRVDARSSEVVYTCAVCGTRVRLEVATTAKAPKHCGEEMEPSLA
jgi:hypothetical protein